MPTAVRPTVFFTNCSGSHSRMAVRRLRQVVRENLASWNLCRTSSKTGKAANMANAMALNGTTARSVV